MTDDQLERRLRDAFDAQARSAVRPDAAPPPPRFAAEARPAAPRERRARLLAPLAAAAVVAAVAGAVVVVGHLGADDKAGQPVAASTVAGPPAPQTAVHVRLLNDPGARYGVGMPVIAYFSRTITNGAALQRATSATVDGQPIQGAWYFEPSAAGRGPLEAHFRPRSYWPANADVRVSMPIQGLSAGGKLTFDNSLTIDFHTGPANIATVDERTHRLVLETDNRVVMQAPVSLGSKATPTRPGVKVIMEKPGVVSMSGPGYAYPAVQFAQRLTYGGEYLHSAPWNEKNIESGVDSSNGCTNLLPQDARRLFGLLEIGDVVRYENVDGPPMQLGSGYGDWNVPWSTWLTGGLIPTR